MNFIKKWYTYQKERFPVLMYGSYIACIVFAIYCCCLSHISLFEQTIYSADISNTISNWKITIPMFLAGFIQLLMVRIVDEFKDYEEDSKYRPYRPVPRGLITLNELSVLFIICILIQIAITFIFKANFILLVVLWVFFFIMSRGFFIKKFLDKHLLLEVLYDELMMPIMVLYLSSFCLNKWELIALSFNTNFTILLIISYVVSWTAEIARKVRCKEDEEKGVRTYTAVLGIPKAMLLLSVLESMLYILQSIALAKMQLLISIIYAIIIILNLVFMFKQNKLLSKIVSLSANLYIVFIYVSMIFLII